MNTNASTLGAAGMPGRGALPGRLPLLMIAAAVLRDVLQHPTRARSDLQAAKGAGGVYSQEHDHLPLLYSALSLQHVLQYRKEIGIDRAAHEDLVAAQFFDVQYDGSPLDIALVTVPVSPVLTMLPLTSVVVSVRVAVTVPPTILVAMRDPVIVSEGA